MISTAESAELRGSVIYTNEDPSTSISWDGTNWSALYLELNDAGSNTETLYYENTDSSSPAICNAPNNDVIDEKELIYSTHTYSKKFKLSAKTDATVVDTFSIIPWFGQKYVAVNDDATTMAPLLMDVGGGFEKHVNEGESMEMKGGYSLEVSQLDVDGGKVFVTLYKNGDEIDSSVLDMEGSDDDRAFTVKDDFAGHDDQIYFVAYVDNTFRSSSGAFAVFKYIWLIDKNNVKVVEDKDELGVFKCRDANEKWINMSNDKQITLNLDDKIYLTDDWYIKTSKKVKGGGGYRFYPAMSVDIKPVETVKSTETVNNVTETSPEVDETVEKEDDSSIISDDTVPAEETIEEPPSADSKAESSEQHEVSTEASIPGFVSITAISGLAGIFFLLKHREH